MDAKNLNELNQRRRVNGEFGNKYHAEAEAELGDQTEAQKELALNDIRSRASVNESGNSVAIPSGLDPVLSHAVAKELLGDNANLAGVFEDSGMQVYEVFPPGSQRIQAYELSPGDHVKFGWPLDVSTGVVEEVTHCESANKLGQPERFSMVKVRGIADPVRAPLGVRVHRLLPPDEGPYEISEIQHACGVTQENVEDTISKSLFIEGGSALVVPKDVPPAVASAAAKNALGPEAEIAGFNEMGLLVYRTAPF